MLLHHNASVHIKNTEGRDALALAVLSGAENEEIIRALLIKGADPNSTFTDDCGRIEMSVLLSVAMFGQEDVVRLLLSYGADPNYRCRDGFTALHVAAYWDFTPVFMELIKARAEWTRDGAELLALASGRNSAIAQKLINYGVDPKQIDGRGGSKLDIYQPLPRGSKECAALQRALDLYAAEGVHATFVRGELIGLGKRR